MKVHLVGMGILGSILAWNFHNKNIDFTWEDNRQSINAWRACTGAVYPSGHQEDLEGLSRWHDWYSGHVIPRECLEVADYWFNHKNPPHNGRYEIVNDLGALRMGKFTSVHVNGQLLVNKTRFFFKEKEKTPNENSKVIISHGFSKRLSHYYWGWTAKVNIKTSLPKSERRPCVYLRKGRFIMAYLYPIPNEDYWYAGSSIIKQKSPHSLNIRDKINKWVSHVHKLSGGLIEVTHIEFPLMEGWRPATQEKELVKEIHNKLYVKPLWNNGVRHSPLVVEEVFKWLNT